MGFKIDCHVHSEYSGDSAVRGCTPKRVIKRAIDKGLDGIVVCDARADVFFDEVRKKPELYLPDEIQLIKGSDEALYVRGRNNGDDGNNKNNGFYVLRGMEHHDDKGHLLEIGGHSQIVYRKEAGLNERIFRAHNNGGLIGIAHPFYTDFGGVSREDFDKIIDNVDFVEIFNAISTPNYNDMAMVEAERYSVPGLSNSDDHNAKPGRGYTVLGIEPEESIDDTVDAIKGAIKEGNIVSYNKEYTGFLEKLWIFLGKDVSAGHFGPVADRVGRVLKLKNH